MPTSDSCDLCTAVWSNGVTKFVVLLHAALALTTLMSIANTHTKYLPSCFFEDFLFEVRTQWKENFGVSVFFCCQEVRRKK